MAFSINPGVWPVMITPWTEDNKPDFNAIKHTLAQEIAADPAKVDAALDLLMVIKYLERIGDHAVNVAEWVQFVRTGRYKDESMF